MSFRAMYRGVCGSCGEAIAPGDECAYDEGSVVHEDCVGAPRVRVTVKQAETCTDCWLEKPCPCDDDRRAA
mgnify:CR=1 FL=1